MNKKLKQPKLFSSRKTTGCNNFVTYLLRSFLLLAIMVMGASNVWGQLSFGKAEINAEPTSTSALTEMSTTSGSVSAWYYGTTTEFNSYGGKSINDKWFVKLTDQGYIKIRVAKGSVVAGDILRVETIDIYQNGDPQNLGFKVAGSNGTITLKETDNALHILDYPLKAADIDKTDASYDYIQIDRNGNSGCGYHSVEIIQGCTVSFSPNNNERGTVTAKRLDTNEDISSGTRVPYGTSIELTAHPKDGYVFSSWSNGEKVLTRIWTVTADGHPSANFEAEGEGYTVTFSGLYGGGNVTAKRLDTNTEITSGKKVPSGTEVTFTATPSGENLKWKWVIDGTDRYSQDPQTISITKDITVNHQFGSVYVNVYTNDANLGTVNIAHKGNNATTFHVTPWAGTFTLTATPTANGTFMGWYKDADHTQKINDAGATYEINNPEGTNNYFALFEAASTDHPVPTCVNNTIDLSKIKVVSGASYDPSTHQGSITANYGTISIKFNGTADLHELNSLTLAGTNVVKNGDAGAFNGVSFKYVGGDVTTYNYPFTISDENKAKLNAVTEITLFGDDNNHKGDFTLTSITLNFDDNHVKTTPVLNGETTDNMVVSAGIPFTLSATNGFWREYKSDQSGPKDNNIITGYPTQYTFEHGLEAGEYYFGVIDDTYRCTFDQRHTSAPVVIHVTVKEAFNPKLALNGTPGGNVVSYENGVLTVSGGSNNVINVKNDVAGHGSQYTGIRLTTQGKASRIIVRWGPVKDPDTERSITVIDAAEKATTSYYSWSMLGVPENKIASISDIYFAGAQDWSYSADNHGVTTFSNASLVNVTEATPYGRKVGGLSEFNLKDTRVNIYDTRERYQMGNVQWVYKSETNGDNFVTMKTSSTSNNMMEVFNPGYFDNSYKGVSVDYKGKHFRIVAYTNAYNGGTDGKFTYVVPESDTRKDSFIPWAAFNMTDADVADLLRIEVAGCSEHAQEEAVNFYGIRLTKELSNIINTVESDVKGVWDGNSKLTYTRNIDGNEMKLVFDGITTGGDRHANDANCNGVILKKADGDTFTLYAPGGHKIKKVIVGLGEPTTGKVSFNYATGGIVSVTDATKIEWTNTHKTMNDVRMAIPKDDNAAEAFHITYVYYELAEEEINNIEVNGQTRQYDMYVPADLTSSSTDKVGVVISLHGASKDYWDNEGRINFNAIADAKKSIEGKKFVVVYPRGLMRQLRGQERGWESYTENNTEDVEFFKAIVNDINGKNGLTVDMNRIYLAGYANGGMMAYKAAHQAGDFFAAFASVGGFPVNESHLFHAGAQPTPFMHIQGAADEIFNDTEYNYFTISHNMTYRNGAHFNAYDTSNNSDGGVIAENSNVIREIHVAENGGAPYYLYTITGMTHVPAYNWDGVAGDDVAPSIWNFFDKMTEYYKVDANKIDKTLKFRMYDPENLWDIATTGKSHAGVQLPDNGYIGFDNVGQTVDGKSYVLSYGGRTNTKGDKGTTFDKDARNKNTWHSLQFNGGINGAAHFLKLNVETDEKVTENPNEFFLVKLTKTGATTPVFAKRYQAGRGHKDLYINFSALPGFNEYKLEITKSSSDLVVKVHGIEAYSGRCEDKSTNEKQIEENPTAFYDVATVLTGMNPIYQPIFGKSYVGYAKEYLPIADIPVGIIPAGNTYRPSDIPTEDDKGNDYDYRVINDDLVGNTALTSLPSTVITDWGDATSKTISGTTHGSSATQSYGKLFNIAISGKDGEDTGIKSNNAFIFVPNGQTYTIDKVKGLNISQLGRAMMPEYLNGTRGAFPEHGVIAIKLQGTLDFYLLAQNEIEYGTNSEGKWDPNSARRTLKVYYTNDQLDGELKELKEWDFFGTRSENGYSDKNGQSLAALSAGVRLPQLGKDGTCTVFITYEGKRENGGAYFTHAPADEGKIWIKGFVIKRPDLKVTIGRTDSKYSGEEYKGENNTKCTSFGENKPYIWSFENVGFNNTRKRTVNSELQDDTQKKKVNEKDGRTYVCGGKDDQVDHLLLYSDGASANVADKVQFDGRILGQEHIEFLKASNYDMKGKPVTDRKLYDPVHSNGLKVNVTGSGWFKIQCSAPNGPVNMKVYTQPNYGSSYISLLREFRVEKTASDVDWKEYTVYLKSRGIHEGNNGFWDGATTDNGKEEIMRQSLFVVFDEINDNQFNGNYDESHPQLNIHQLSWLNEEPADYVFQREEDPKLLTTWQAIRRDNNGKITTDKAYAPILWWKAGNDDDQNYTMLKENGEDTYDRLGQYTSLDNAGVKSPGGYASTSVPSDAGQYDAYWDIAAPASTNSHTEAAYAKGNTSIDSESSPQYEYDGANEFSVPVSGSFIRICAMKNTQVVAHVLPLNINGNDHSVYVLDETGAQIPFSANDDDAKRRGYIVDLINDNGDLDGGRRTENRTIRIDFTANAGKEYFICTKDAMLSLARLEVHDWKYKPAKTTKLALTDGASGTTNSDAITTAYNAGNYYMDANLHRKVGSNWISLVLPFSMNEKKFEEVFGKGARCIHFTGVDIPNKTVKLTHHYYNMIVAGRPVFVKPGTSPNVDADGYLKDITDVTLQTKTVKNYESVGNFQFIGSYDNITMYRNDLFMNNANAIKYLTDVSATYPGMRSFIKNNGGPDFYNIIGSSSSTGAKATFLNFCDLDEDAATGIEELISAEFGENAVVVTKSTKAYDLNGRVIAEGADINSLPAGIYVVNGKKYAVVK